MHECNHSRCEKLSLGRARKKQELVSKPGQQRHRVRVPHSPISPFEEIKIKIKKREKKLSLLEIIRRGEISLELVYQ